MATRCPACGEFIGDNTFGKHNCGKAIEWNAVELASTDAEIARLTALLAEAREERVEAAKRLSKQAARWLDDFIADSELIDAINGELAAALAKLGA